MGEVSDIRREPGSDIVCLEENGYRPSHKGDGYRVGGAMYTLNSTEAHGVCYSIDMGGGKSSCVVLENKSPTLTCTHYGEPAICYEKKRKEHP